MRTALIVLLAIFAFPNSGRFPAGDSFAFISVYPLVMSTPAAMYGSFGGDNQGSMATNEIHQAVTMPRDYTIQSIGATCSTGFSGGSWRASLYKFGVGTIVIGPSMTSGGTYFSTAHQYAGSAGDEVGPIIARIGSATFPGYCRVSVQGVWR